MQKELKWKK